MFSENRGITITIILVILISISALGAVVYSLVLALREVEFGNLRALSPDRNINIVPQQYNYNFAIPAVEVSDAEKQVPSYNYNFSISQEKTLPQMISVQIPSINYFALIVGDENTNSISNNKLWHAPSSHPMEGSAILQCLDQQNSAGCQYLSQTKAGDNLYINFQDGTQKYYTIISISNTSSQAPNINITEKTVTLISNWTQMTVTAKAVG